MGMIGIPKGKTGARVFFILVFLGLGITSAFGVFGSHAMFSTVLWLVSFAGVAAVYPWGQREADAVVPALKEKVILSRVSLSGRSFQGTALAVMVGMTVVGQMYLYEGWRRPHGLLLGLIFFAMAFVAMGVAFRGEGGERPLKELKPWQRNVGLGAILFTGVFLRLYDLSSLPWGLYQDESFVGLESLRILKGEFQSPFLAGWASAFILPWYIFALFIKLWGVNELALRLPVALLGSVSLLLFWGILRMLVDERAALAATLILAASHVHLFFSRYITDFPILFWEFCLVYFYLKGMRTGRKSAYVLGSLALGLSLYTFVPALTLPLIVMAFFICTFAVRRGSASRLIRGAVLSIILFFVLAGPFAVYFFKVSPSMFNTPWTGGSGRSILPEVRQQHSLMPIWNHFSQMFLVYNYQGDNATVIIPNKPAMDFLSGILFLMGLALALMRCREEKYLLGLMWLLIGWMPHFFSRWPTIYFHSYTGLLVGVLFAGYFVESVWRTAEKVLPESWGRYMWLPVVAGGLFIVAANYHIYFDEFRSDTSCYANGGTSLMIAKDIARRGVTTRSYLHMFAFKDITIKFRTTGYQSDLRNLDLTEQSPVHDPADRDVVYYLHLYESPVLEVLASVYPEGKRVDLSDPWGVTDMILYEVPKKAVAAGQGLTAQYYRGRGTAGQPFVKRVESGIRVDGVIDGAFGPVTGVWTGTLCCDTYGAYAFRVSGAARVGAWIDGQEVKFGTPRMLYRGSHPIRVKAEGLGMGGIELLWKRPAPAGSKGVAVYERIPLEQLSVREDPRGVLVRTYKDGSWEGAPVLEERMPMVACMTWIRPGKSMRWEGLLKVDKEGGYGLMVESNQEVLLYVDGRLVVEHQGGENSVGKVRLSRGKHRFELKMKILRFGPALIISLKWKEPGKTEFKAVPYAAYLFK